MARLTESWKARLRERHKTLPYRNYLRWLHAERSRKRRREKWNRIDMYKHIKGCANCTTHYGDLEFHHPGGFDPEKDLRIGASYDYSWKRLSREMLKCQVLCVKCHHVLHPPPTRQVA